MIPLISPANMSRRGSNERNASTCYPHQSRWFTINVIEREMQDCASWTSAVHGAVILSGQLYKRELSFFGESACARRGRALLLLQLSAVAVAQDARRQSRASRLRPPPCASGTIARKCAIAPSFAHPFLTGIHIHGNMLRGCAVIFLSESGMAASKNADLYSDHSMYQHQNVPSSISYLLQVGISSHDDMHVYLT